MSLNSYIYNIKSVYNFYTIMYYYNKSRYNSYRIQNVLVVNSIGMRVNRSVSHRWSFSNLTHISISYLSSLERLEIAESILEEL